MIKEGIMKKFTIVLLLLIVGGTFVFAQGSKESHELNYEKEWSSGSFDNLDLGVTVASMNILRSTNDKGVLKIYGRAPFNSVEEFIEVTDNNGTLTVKQIKKLPRRIKKYRLNVDLYLPDSSYNNIDLALVTGIIKVQRDIKCKDFTASGTTVNIDINQLESERADISTVTGDIDIKDMIGDVSVNVVTGSIDVEYNTYKDEDITLSCTTGGIKLTLPEDSGFNLKTSTVTGSVDCDFPVTVNGNLNNRNVSGTVNEGLGNVKASLVTGSIYIKN